MHHTYYYDPKVLDLNKIRKDAEERATNGHWENESTLIHWHKANEKCDGHKHEEYKAK